MLPLKAAIGQLEHRNLFTISNLIKILAIKIAQSKIISLFKIWRFFFLYGQNTDWSGLRLDREVGNRQSKTPKFALMKRLTARSETLIMTINLEKNQFVQPVKIIHKEHLQKIETHQQLSLLDIM